MEILLADDHVLFREALIQFINPLRPAWTITTASNFTDALALLDKGLKFDIILLDMRMPGMNGLQGLEKLREAYPNQITAILSGVAEEHHVKEALKIGARAYFPKTLSGKALVKAIELVMSGQRFVPMDESGLKVMPSYYDDHDTFHGSEKKDGDDDEDGDIRSTILAKLTKRERQVAQLLAQGLSNKEIADDLDLQIATVKLHVSAVCKKLNVNNRTQAAILMHQHGLNNEIGKSVSV